MIEYIHRKSRAIDEADLLNRIREYGCNLCHNRGEDMNGAACESCYLTSVEQWISEQETFVVNPEPNTAHWDISCDGYYPYCSACRKEPPGREMSAYCPNCGAKMVTRQKERMCKCH